MDYPTFKHKLIQHAHKQIANITQYTDGDHIDYLCTQYSYAINLLKELNKTRVVDVGSGVGIAKIINPNIVLADLYTDQGRAWSKQFFQDVSTVLDTVPSIRMQSFTPEFSTKWIDTEQTFDAVMLLRFMPWSEQHFDKQNLKNMFTEINRIMADGGVLLYRPIDTQKIAGMLVDYKIIEHNIFLLTKQQINNAIEML